MKKKIFNFCIIATPFIMFFILIFQNRGSDNLVVQLSKLNPLWILIALILIFLYWFFEAMALHVITEFYNIKRKIKEAFSVTMVGQFFNSLTPFATGGQPAQVVYLHKKGMSLGDATAIVMLKFFVYQSVLTIYSAIIILVTFPLYITRIPLLISMTVLGLGVHASMIILTLLFSYNRTLSEKIIKFIFRVLKKLRIVKGKEGAEKKLEDNLSVFHDNAKLLRKNPKLLVRTSILIFLQMTAYFSIPFFIGLAFNVSNLNYSEYFAAAVFVATIISIVPLPGATGGAEGGFYLFYVSLFGENLIVTAIIVWRLITYYSCIAFGGLYAVLPDRKKAKQLNKTE